MSYRFALFDADNTLLDFSRAEREALSDCLAARGLRHDEIVTTRYAAINDAQWKRLEQGLTTRKALQVDRFTLLAEEFAFSLDPLSLLSDYMEALSQKTYLMAGAEELILAVKDYCRLFIITNGTLEVQRPRLARCPLMAHFERVFISEEVGANKPERAFFEHVFSSIPDFRPEEALVIGDSLTSDIRGGAAAGLATCWFAPDGRRAPGDISIMHTVRSLAEIVPLLIE